MKFSRCAFVALFLAAPSAQAQDADALAIINAHRQNNGCGPLVLQPQLQTAAEIHARDMAVQNFFNHTGKNGLKFSDRITARGYDGNKIGENIAAGQSSSAAVVAAWMASPGHKRNILDCRFVDTGLAFVYQPDDAPLNGNNHAFKYYWVQTFGAP